MTTLLAVVMLVGCEADRPPVAEDAVVTVDEDGAATASLHGSDPDGDELTFALADPPEQGTATLTDEGALSYTPDPDFSGTDALTFTVATDVHTSDPATVSITVTAVNDAPVSADDSAQTLFETPLTLDVLANDTDVDGDVVVVDAVVQPLSGTVTIEDDDTVTYTPAAGFYGTDSFSYTAGDGALQDSADVNIEVVDPCVTPFLTLSGSVSTGAGLAMWNSSGGAEPAMTGHHLGDQEPALTGVYAQYYLASRDRIGGSFPAASVTALGPMPQTATALAAGGYTADQIGLSVDLQSLNDDTLGWDWFWYTPFESRMYRDSSTGATPDPAYLVFTLDGEDLVSDRYQLGMNIDYGDLSDPSDDTYRATAHPTWQDISDDSSNAVQAVAAAMLADFDGGTWLDLPELVVAFEGDFGAEGRTGLYLDVVGAGVYPYCE